jgi:ABC-type sugar transport system substrate-binding protein
LEGVMSELADTDIQMVIENGDWSVASGTRAVRNWLRKGCAPAHACCAVGAQNDRMALGARAGLVSAAIESQDPGLAHIPVTGCDGTLAEGQACVMNKELCATVVMPATTATAVDEIVLALDSGHVPSAQITLGVTSFPKVELVARPDALRATPRTAAPRPRPAPAGGPSPDAR